MRLALATVGFIAFLLPAAVAQDVATKKPANYAYIHAPHSKTVWHAGQTVSVHWSYVHTNNTVIYRADLLRGVKHDLEFITTLCYGGTPRSTSCTAKLPTDLWEYTYTVRVSPDVTILPSDKSDFFLIKNPNDPRSTTTTTTTRAATRTTTQIRTTTKPVTTTIRIHTTTKPVTTTRTTTKPTKTTTPCTTTTTKTKTKTKIKTKTKTKTKKPRDPTKVPHPTTTPAVTTNATSTLPPPLTSVSTASVRLPMPTGPSNVRSSANEMVIDRSAFKASVLAAAFTLVAI
ncbi:hypothetical protein BGZ73_003199, partial [Actinomortierella ambigua]